MCGITGFIALDRALSGEDCNSRVLHMTRSVSHRGPDDSGYWADSENRVFIGHRRLSILDLTKAGAQPMTSREGRYILSYNGEIYNYPDMKAQLESEGMKFRGHSDTETLLTALENWGIDKTLRHIKGMFAFALWDKREKVLHLVRDHIGKKPLYYGFTQDGFVFASELKAIRAASKQTPDINREALSTYTRYGFVPAPYSIYEKIYKLQPGHILSLRLDDLDPGMDITAVPRPFWRLSEVIQKRPATMNASEIKEKLKFVLGDAVSSRMISDVPLGGFLSGGIDSSLIVALMQEASGKPVQTYCIGFEEAHFDESPFAQEIADHLGTDHTAYTVTAGETRDVIPDIPEIYDEPFADYSQIPTYHLCRLARKKTTVALSGDGGDELFCGYSRYFMALELYRKTGKIPGPLRHFGAGLLNLTSESALNLLGGVFSKLPVLRRYDLDGKRLHSIARMIGAQNFEDMMQRLMSCSNDPEKLIPAGYNGLISPQDDYARDLSPLEKMMAFDTSLYLPDDILVKVDRASMAVSLEVRSPLLDKDVIEFAWSLPIEDKIYYGQMRGKKPLYDLLLDYVPRELVDRPKQGFSVPMAEWLRGPLKEWGADLLAPSCVERAGLYSPGRVQALWQEFQKGKTDCHEILWTILMAQAWHTRWIRA